MVLFKEDREMAIPMQIMGLRISKVGLTFKISLELIGVTIYWDAQRSMNIEATAALFNRTAGLCGTLDQDITNDFASKDRTVHKVRIFKQSFLNKENHYYYSILYVLFGF